MRTKRIQADSAEILFMSFKFSLYSLHETKDLFLQNAPLIKAFNSNIFGNIFILL